ncbi:PorT family protein [Marinoscillum sp. MHG1-6]|uniref:PorT family protein n=1 Tax=Marinoscillum sp. MHG1-6 TaxID=2959627 RepID=UPI002157DF8E|nr:PorT family protein [Marinoscillum sp. MHG1-6]
MKKIVLIIFLISVGTIHQLLAQNCTQRLNKAEDDYEAGRLLAIPGVINDLLSADCLSKEEEIRARKLLTKTYIFMDEETKAEIALIGLLKADPEHQLDNQVDPRELEFLMAEFRTDPILRIALRIGANMTMINIIDDYSYSPTNTETFPKYYNGKLVSGSGSGYKPVSGQGIGLTIELMAERHLWKGIEVAGGPQIRISSYNVDTYLVNSSTVSSVNNRQVYFRTPVLARYNLWYSQHQAHKIKPYVYGGMSADFLMSGTYAEASRQGGTAYTLPGNRSDLQDYDLVNTFDVSWFGGLGMKLRIKTHYLTVEARYDNALTNYIKAENRYESKSTSFDLGYVPDNVSINALSFTVGWSHSIYSPKKIY